MIDREALARAMYESTRPALDWTSLLIGDQALWLDRADALIASQDTWLRVPEKAEVFNVIASHIGVSSDCTVVGVQGATDAIHALLTDTSGYNKATPDSRRGRNTGE